MNTWSDDEIALRWWRLFPQRRNEDHSPEEPTEMDLNMIRHDAKGHLEKRRRLSDISWFMTRRATTTSCGNLRVSVKRVDGTNVPSRTNVPSLSSGWLAKLRKHLKPDLVLEPAWTRHFLQMVAEAENPA